MSLDHQVPWWKKIKFENRVLLVLILMSGIYYLSSMNQIMINTFKLNDLQNRVEALGSDNNDYQMRKSALESYSGDLVERAKNLNMVNVDQVIYLSNHQVVAKK